MPKISSKSKFPSYRHHKARGLAVVTLNGRDIYLGPYGTETSKIAYDRVIAEWLANGRQLPTAREEEQPDVTVAELIAAYWRHAGSYYTKDGTPTSEQSLIKLAMRPLRRLYGTTFASDFGPLALKAVRQAMIDNDGCRTTVNGLVDRVRRMFRWGVENELVRPEVYQGLRAVSGLRRGRTEARETVPVKPVPDEFVDAIEPMYLDRPGRWCSFNG